MSFISYADLGRKIANPYAVPANNLKLDDCPCTADVTCEDTLTSATIAGSEVIVNVIFNGVTYLPGNDVKGLNGDVIMEAPGTITAADTAELREWLEAVASIWEFDPYIEVTHATTTLTVKHYGALTMTSITTDAPETITGTRCCLMYDMFTNSISLPVGSYTNITFDGVTAALDDGTYPINTDAAVLKTDIESELTALSIPFESVTVTYDAVDDEHDVVIVSTARVISVDALELSNTASSEAFVCP